MNVLVSPSAALWTRFCFCMALAGISVVSLTPACGAVQHVIQISVDGLRGDKLQELVQTFPGTFPGFVRLQEEGAFTYNARCDYDYSVTVPNHATMVTGRPVAQPEGHPDTTHHGFNTNFPQPNGTLHNSGNANLSYVSSAFDVVHDHGLATAYYAGKTRLEYIHRSYNEINGAADEIGEDDGTGKIDFSIVQEGNTQALIDAIVDDIAQGAVNYTFVHITDPDTAGHASGWISMAWESAVAATDEWIVQILEAIDANPALAGKVAVTLTGDHGGGGGTPNNHTDATLPENYVIPFFVWGGGVAAGTDLHTQFLNRVDPGLDRPSYEGDQPLRNGDAANLSLALLGLPPVPGSFLLPEIGFGGFELDMERLPDRLRLSWPSSPGHLILECATDLTSGDWTKIVEGIGGEGDIRAYETSFEEADSRYYRLRTPAFRITGQPRSVIAHVGEDVTFTIVTDVSGLRIQWQREGIDLPGANGASLVLGNVQLSQQGNYTAVVSDGIDSITSEPAVLSFLLNPVITSHPQSRTNNVGTEASFTVVATGSGSLAYQWRHNGIDIPGATDATLTLSEVSSADEGAYTVLVSDQSGATLSDPAMLTVLQAPVVIEQPLAQTVNVGDTVTFTVVIEGNPPPFNYRWRRNNLTVTTLVSNERTSTLVIEDVQLTHAGRYDVVITNPANPTPGALSVKAELTVLEP